MSADVYPRSTAEGRQRLEGLHAELAAEVLQRVDAGVCGCGCGETLGLKPGRRRYVNSRHRQRAHRHRLELEAKALSVPARLSLQALRGYEPTGERHADAQTPRTPPKRRRSPRPGVTVYLPTVELAEAVLANLDGRSYHAGAYDVAIEALERALERRRRRARAA